jgi:mRNA-degrading endonuclease toxin of MazEF toxin-antitoxin module
MSRNPAPWPFKIELSSSGRIQGNVLVDQIRSIDRDTRFVRRAKRAGAGTLDRVYGVIAGLLDIPVS